MADDSGTSRSLFSYYGSSAGIDGSRQLPVLPEELEYFAEQELITIVPNFSLDGGSKLFCIGGTYGPFTPNMPTDVPLWLALMLHKRKKCRIQPPAWMKRDDLEKILHDEKTIPQYFQPLPFYYIEISKILFEKAVDAFGDDFSEVRHLLESIRRVRYHKIATGLRLGLRKVEKAVPVKLNNLSAAECNSIRLLFKGTLDHFHQLTKRNKEW
eukprot:CAMPEP_0202914660 /NCGR_PEP_ID=MMETSP1392-20130828/63646_1 /ASSEMBLY_ACC=CAM_ASM_000868 /TAXON_ID=225041 /ORGANISM="Chlamydomonas chlamydogama, Strain SAG 11-48b" /LENGTH=211 /DNA_ID=CAMNT_0049606395 /DNA_START=89 /DNA_END=721 /DNA_ORIENTATION=-